MISMLFYCLAQACSITEGVLLVYCVLTWFVSPASRVMQILSGIIDPMLMPIRRLFCCWRFRRSSRSSCVWHG